VLAPAEDDSSPSMFSALPMRRTWLTNVASPNGSAMRSSSTTWPGEPSMEGSTRARRAYTAMQPSDKMRRCSADGTRTPAPEPIAETADKERPQDQVFAMEESNAGTAPSGGAPLKLKSDVLQLLQAWDVSDAADALEKHGWTSLKKMQLMEDADVDAIALLPATKKVLNTQLRTWKTEAAAGRECADISATAVSAGTSNPSSAPTTTGGCAAAAHPPRGGWCRGGFDCRQ
jgi:hypothetical protein